MPGLEIRDWITLGGMAVTAVSAFVAVKTEVGGLRGVVQETLRQVAAIHKRLDAQSERIARLDRDQAVLRERLSNLRITQRFKLPETTRGEGE